MPREYWPRRLLPPQELIDRWQEIAERRDEPVEAYVARWTGVWRRVLRACQDQGTWDDRDLDLLLELVEWRRLADHHQREADDDPYTEHRESGRVFAHPGFDKARDARREARELAGQLLLTPESRRAAGLDDEGDDDGAGGATDQTGL